MSRRGKVVGLAVAANLLLLLGGIWLDAPRGSGVAPPLAWEELVPEDWIYDLWTRVTRLEEREVHYPTPVEELAQLLENRSERDAPRHRADALQRLDRWDDAWASMKSWAERTGPGAWAEAARWAASHRHYPEAFEAHARASRGLVGDARRQLGREAIAWAEAHPGLADPLGLRQELADAFPEDAALFRDLVSALRRAGQAGELGFRISQTRALPEEEKLLLRAQVASENGGPERGFALLDPEAVRSHDAAFDNDYSSFVDRARPTLPDDWRSALEKDWDRESFARLCSYLKGHGRGAAVKELVEQVERRYATRFSRADHDVLAALLESAGGVEGAFRLRLAAASLGDEREQQADLAELGRLAIVAGAAPLPYGRYRDEGMRLVARMDRTPGIWSGGLAFLMTGQDWPSALADVERAALPDRTFAVARAIAAELEQRESRHAGLPGLWNSIAQRHLDRGEAEQALELARKVRFGAPEERESARRLETVAMRQVVRPLEEEVEVYRRRLLHLWPTGGRLPTLVAASSGEARDADIDEESMGGDEGWDVPEEEPGASSPEDYRAVLDEAIARIEERDRSHRTSVRFILAEMDRHPEDEELWLDLAEHLSTWGLDDDLGPRYERAAARFEGPGVWQKLARWYARRRRASELDALARTLVATFRESAIFERADAGKLDLDLPVDPRPAPGERVLLLPYADLVRILALHRFPHSPRVVDEAAAALSRHRARIGTSGAGGEARLDALMDARSAAVLYVDGGRREAYLSGKMEEGSLEDFLAKVAKEPADPVRDRLLLDGHARLSLFDRASPAADRLLASYPGDAGIVTEALQLHRSLSAIEEGHAQAARALVDREAPVLGDPAPALTEVGELLHDRGRVAEALGVWSRIGALDPHDRARVEELATLYWDYDHMKEALAVVEEARTRLGEPWLLAFEAGVLREELHDLPGAIKEYVATLAAEGSDWSASERATRRLAQLSGRPSVRAAIEAAIAGVTPGQPPAEEELLRLLHLATLTQDDLGYEDDWLDAEDMPRDPVGQELRQDARESARESVVAGIEKTRGLLLEKTLAMVRATGRLAFLKQVEPRREDLARGNAAGDQELQVAMLSKRAELETTAEGKVQADSRLLTFLVEAGRTAEADALAAELWPRIAALPEGAGRMRAELMRPWFIEKREGADRAAGAWAELAKSYPWSLGMLEDRQTFLQRTSKRPEARAALEEAAGRAAPSHRIAFLSRVADDAMTKDPVDLDTGRRALDAMLASPGLAAADRRRAAALRIKLALRANEPGDVVALASTQAAALPRDERADAWSELARTAAGEGATGVATHMWIEALKQRLDLSWLREACTTAERAGKLDTLQRFFEEQVKASPRDVHGLVALRDVRAYRGDVEGAIQSARATVKMRPELEENWRTAAGLLERAGRPGEAADLVADFARARQSREDVAQWWSSLEARSGDSAAALRVERDAVAFWESLHPGEEAELTSRRSRAAIRLLELGLAAQAWELLVSGADLAPLFASDLSATQVAELAMRAGKLTDVLAAKAADRPWLEEAASAIHAKGTPRELEQVSAMALDRCAQGPSLQVWWPFVTASGLAGEVGTSLAARYAAATPGPWQASPPASFLETVGARMVGRAASGELVMVAPELEPFWVLELVGSGREDDLVRFLEPRLLELLTRARGSEAVPDDVAVVPVATWLDAEACRMLAEGLARFPELRSRLEETIGDPAAVPRFWLLAGRRLAMGPILEALSPEVRTAWFQSRGALPGGPGAASIAAASRIAGAFVSGEPVDKADPVLAKLRGPRDVGSALKPAPALRFEELRGEVLPAEIWSEAPREPWLALETLARFRLAEADPAAVPLESAALASEGARTLLGMRLALAGGQPERALALDAAAPRSGVDLPRLRARLRALRESGGAEQLRREWSADVARIQGRLEVPAYRELRGMAIELGLPAPLEVMAPETEIAPALLAYLIDEEGPAATARLKVADLWQLKNELGNRLAGREHLSPELFRHYVENVWVDSYVELPRGWLEDAGGIWEASATWLSGLELHERKAAVKALLAYPDVAAMEPLVEGDDEEAEEVLGPWMDVARGDDEAAEARVRTMMASLESDSPWGDEGSGSREPSHSGQLPPFLPRLDGDRSAERLHDALAPFRAAGGGRAARICSEVRKAALERMARGLFSARLVDVALACSPDPVARSAVMAEVERAWVRGDVPADRMPALVEVLAVREPASARRFLDRWPAPAGADESRRRARVQLQLALPADAARDLAAARTSNGDTIGDQLRAFRLFAAAVGAAGRASCREALALAPDWDAALALEDAALASHVASHPHDVFAASRLLAVPAPLDREAATVARRALSARGLLPDDARRLLAVRQARAALPAGEDAPAVASLRRGAFTRLGDVDLLDLAEELDRDGHRPEVVDEVVADLGVLAASAANARMRDEALRVLEERGSGELRARVAAAAAHPKVGPVRPDGTGPYLPKDLDLTLVSRILDATEGS